MAGWLVLKYPTISKLSVCYLLLGSWFRVGFALTTVVTKPKISIWQNGHITKTTSWKMLDSVLAEDNISSVSIKHFYVHFEEYCTGNYLETAKWHEKWKFVRSPEVVFIFHIRVNAQNVLCRTDLQNKLWCSQHSYLHDWSAFPAVCCVLYHLCISSSSPERMQLGQC